MLHPNYLGELVNIGGVALEQEDRFIAGCVTVNPHLYGDENPCGLLRIVNERYYQFVISRALMSAYRYRVNIEEDRRDFVLRDRSGGEWIATGEMKLWLSSRSETDLPSIRSDIAKLRNTPSRSGFLLVATAWRPQEAETYLEILRTRLELTSSPATSQYRFRTIGWRGNRDVEFALLGLAVI